MSANYLVSDPAANPDFQSALQSNENILSSFRIPVSGDRWQPDKDENVEISCKRFKLEGNLRNSARKKRAEL